MRLLYNYKLTNLSSMGNRSKQGPRCSRNSGLLCLIKSTTSMNPSANLEKSSLVEEDFVAVENGRPIGIRFFAAFCYREEVVAATRRPHVEEISPAASLYRLCQDLFSEILTTGYGTWNFLRCHKSICIIGLYLLYEHTQIIPTDQISVHLFFRFQQVLTLCIPRLKHFQSTPIHHIFSIINNTVEGFDSE